MDEILEILFGELCQRIKECREKNPLVDMAHIEHICVLIQSYIPPHEKPKQDISYEDLSKITRTPRMIPKGHLGPSYSMIRYAEEEDNKRARRVDYIIQYVKKLQENKRPFF